MAKKRYANARKNLTDYRGAGWPAAGRHDGDGQCDWIALLVVEEDFAAAVVDAGEVTHFPEWRCFLF